MFKGQPRCGNYLQTGFLKGRSLGLCMSISQPPDSSLFENSMLGKHYFRYLFGMACISFGVFFSDHLFSAKFGGDHNFGNFSILVTFSHHKFLVTVFTPPLLSQEDVGFQGNSRHSRSEIPLFHYEDRTREKPARW